MLETKDEKRKTKNEPIFIHSLFRTGSTYIWNKFRQNPEYCCYYEPLHQILSEINRENIDKALTHDYKIVKHPELKQHYLEEYKKVLDSSGKISFFKKEFSFDQFCYNGENSDLKKYLDNLIVKAEDKTPILQFNRTALRTMWFKLNYPDSVNLYIFRNPRDQFNSYIELKHRTGKEIFFVMDLLISGKNREKKAFENLSKHIELINFHGSSLEEESFFYLNSSAVYSKNEKYFIFYYIWLISLIENINFSERLININLLTSNNLYRKQFEIYLENLDIQNFDFSDSNIKNYENYILPVSDLDRIETFVNHLVITSLDTEIKSKLRKYIKHNEADFLSDIFQICNENNPNTVKKWESQFIIKDRLLQTIGKISFLFKKGLEKGNSIKIIDDILKVWDIQQKKEFDVNKIRENFKQLKKKFNLEKKTSHFKFELLLSQIKGKDAQINLKQVEYQKVLPDLESARRELELQVLSNEQLKTELDEKNHDIKERKENFKELLEKNINLKKENNHNTESIKILMSKNSQLINEVDEYNKNVQLILNGRSYKLGRSITLLFRSFMSLFRKQKKGRKNKLAFIDHSFHKKSLATEFLINIFKKNFDVQIYWDDSWDNGTKINIFSLIKKGFEYVVFFQSYNYSKLELKLLDGIKIILIPMYDGSGHYDIEFWKKYKKAKIINFSITLHSKLLKFGINTEYYQYFANSKIYKNNNRLINDELKGFFWQRKDHVVWDDIKKLIGKTNFETIHIHKAMDPPKNKYKFAYPEKSEIEKYNLTFSDWFSNKEEYFGKLKKYNVYFAPRLYEGIGMSFLDAMSIGMCVVAPDNPTMNEYITHGVTGLLFNPKNIKSLDFSNAKEIGGNAKKFVEEGYKNWIKSEMKIIAFIKKRNKFKINYKFYFYCIENKLKKILKNKIKWLKF